MKKRILVTGGLGYIGSHTVVELIKAGYETVIIDNLCNSKKIILDRIGIITGHIPAYYNVDLTNLTDTETVFSLEKPFDVIMHFAGLKSVELSLRDPLKYYTNNVSGFLNLLSIPKYNPVTKLIFSSSSIVYGKPNKLPVKEIDGFKKVSSAYGSSKQMCEDIIEKCAAAGKLNAISLRYFNPVGADESLLIGELPVGKPRNLMPILTRVISGKDKCFSIYGNDYDTPDGTCIRDYVHVKDVANAHIISCERLIKNLHASALETYNIGSGSGASVLEILKQTEGIIGKSVQYKISSRRIGDIPEIYADTSLAEQVLNWKNNYNLNNSIKSAIDWQKKLDNLD